VAKALKNFLKEKVVQKFLLGARSIVVTI